VTKVNINSLNTSLTKTQQQLYALFNRNHHSRITLQTTNFSKAMQNHGLKFQGLKAKDRTKNYKFVLNSNQEPSTKANDNITGVDTRNILMWWFFMSYTLQLFLCLFYGVFLVCYFVSLIKIHCGIFSVFIYWFIYLFSLSDHSM